MVAFLGFLATHDSSTLKEFWFVLIGVAMGAVFLPEHDDSTWKLTSEQVRNMVPEHQISSFQQVLIGTRVETKEWAELIWNKGLTPLLQAGVRIDQIVWDAKYDIVINLSDSRALAGNAPVHHVETLSRARRALASVEPRKYWVSAARTANALAMEYSFSNCLTRELVAIPDMDQHSWEEYVKKSCRVRMSIDGVNLRVYTEPNEGLTDTVRWYIDVPESMWARGVVPYTLHFDFPVPRGEQNFPVIFNGYYSAGTTEITLRINDSVDTCARNLSHVSFIASGLGGYAGDFSRSRQSRSQAIIFATPNMSLLWPGSGIYFQWQEDSNAVAS